MYPYYRFLCNSGGMNISTGKCFLRLVNMLDKFRDNLKYELILQFTSE